MLYLKKSSYNGENVFMYDYENVLPKDIDVKK